MTQNSYDDENDDAETNDTVSKDQQAYRLKRARDPLVLMLGMLLFALLAIAGIVVAVTGNHKDPNAVVLPVHTTKSLHQEQPLAVENTAKEDVPAEEMTGGMILDREELPTSKIEELEQHEQPIDLNPMTPVPEFSPQGMHLHRPLQEKQSVTRTAQKKTSQSIKPSDVKTSNALIVIVIDDMGLNHRNSRRIVDLDATITLAYLPYAERLPEQTAKAFAKGHELIVHMPMEPDNVARNNPGPNALLTTLPANENVARLNKNLQQFDRYIGLNNHMGSKMTANAAQMRPVMQEIKAKKLWFLDSKTIGHSVAAKIAEEEGVPFAVRDVFLDNVASVTAVLGQLRETERVANTKGYAIAIGHPHDATIQALQQWLPEAKRKGISIVPLSTIIAKRFPHSDVPLYARVKDRHTQNRQETAKQESVNVPDNG